MSDQTQMQKAAPDGGKIVGPRRASEILAQHLGLDAGVMINTIKAQCFKSVQAGSVTNEQLAAYVSVAASIREQCPGFDPLVPGMLYAYPSKNGGIEVIIGPDGVYALLSSRPDVHPRPVVPEFDDKGNLVSALSVIDVDGRRHPFEYRAYLAEWKIETNPNWKARPIHMLSLRALKQNARQVIHGLPVDADERQIIEAQGVEILAVAPKAPLAKLRARLGVDVAETPALPAQSSETPVAEQPAPIDQTPAAKPKTDWEAEGAKAASEGKGSSEYPDGCQGGDLRKWKAGFNRKMAEVTGEAAPDSDMLGGA